MPEHVPDPSPSEGESPRDPKQSNQPEQNFTASRLLTLAIEDPTAYLDFDSREGVVVRSTLPPGKTVSWCRSVSKLADRLIERGWITAEQKKQFQSQVLREPQRGFTNLECAARMLDCAERFESCFRDAKDPSLNVRLPDEIQEDFESFDRRSLIRMHQIMHLVESATIAKGVLNSELVQKWVPAEELEQVGHLAPLQRRREAYRLLEEVKTVIEFDTDALRREGHALVDQVASLVKVVAEDAREQVEDRVTRLRDAVKDFIECGEYQLAFPIDTYTRRKAAGAIQEIRGAIRYLEHVEDEAKYRRRGYI